MLRHSPSAPRAAVLLLAAALAPLIGFAQQRPAQKKLYKAKVESVGPWTLTRVTRDAAGKQLEYCTATVIVESEQALWVRFGLGTVVWAFMGEASLAIGPEPTVTYWFDDRRKEANTIRMQVFVAPEEDGQEFLGYQQPEDAPDDDKYLKSRKVTFEYKHEGRTLRQVISLKGSQAALMKMFESCQK